MKKILLSAVILALGALLFNSCDKSEIIKEIIEPEEQFLSALNLFEGNFFATPVSHNAGNPEGLRGLNDPALKVQGFKRKNEIL